MHAWKKKNLRLKTNNKSTGGEAQLPPIISGTRLQADAFLFRPSVPRFDHNLVSVRA
jgi:hypothetical protein